MAHASEAGALLPYCEDFAARPEVSVAKAASDATLASSIEAAWVVAGFAAYLVASHLLPGPRTMQRLPYGLNCFLLGSFVVNVLVIQRAQQRNMARAGSCSVASWLALVPLVQLGFLVACSALPAALSALIFDSKYSPACIAGLLVASYAPLAMSGVKSRLQGIFPGRVAGAAVVPVGVALVAESGFWLHALLHPDPMRAITAAALCWNLIVMFAVLLAVSASAGRWRCAAATVAVGWAIYRAATIVTLRFNGTPLHRDDISELFALPELSSATLEWLATAVVGCAAAGLTFLVIRWRAGNLQSLAARVVIGLMLAACVGLVQQLPQPVWAGNVSNLAGPEFQRQMARFGLVAAAEDHDTIFRALPVTLALRSAVPHGKGGLSDAQLLDQIASIDTSLAAILAGPHADLITHEGTLKFMEPTLHSVSVFQNEFVDVWILLEKKYSEGKWRQYALVQDKTVEPNVAHYFQWAFDGSGVLKRRGATCYVCHTSGPRAMREVRPDLLVGKRYAEQMNRYVRELEFVETRFSDAEPQADFGSELAVAQCTQCHSRDGQRGPLYPFHRLTIETLLDRGAMPSGACLSGSDLATIRAWLGEHSK